MRPKLYKDKGTWYIIIAVLCLVLFFIGFKIISNISNDFVENENEEVNEEAIETFNYITNYYIEDVNSLDKVNTSDLIKIEKEKYYSEVDNFFLKIIIDSNSYMKAIYNERYKNTNKGLINEFLNNLKSYFQVTSFLKAQIELLFNSKEVIPVGNTNLAQDLAKNEKDDKIQEKNTQTINVDENNIDGKDKVIIKEDIVFIEDPFEMDEGNIITDENIETIKYIQKLKVDKEKPYILIYHTHGTESYLPIRTNRYHTTKREYNVIKIGDIITEILKEKGHNVKHIDIYHDIPSYSQSYKRSLSTVKEIINKEKNIKIIFDIHRDGIPENASYYKKALAESKVKINGVDVATYTMVIGPENPNKDKILNFAKYIKEVSDKMYPGLCKGIIIKPYGKFNQYVKDHYALIEVGSNLNTIEEAERSAKLIGIILDRVIKGIITD